MVCGVQLPKSALVVPSNTTVPSSVLPGTRSRLCVTKLRLNVLSNAKLLLRRQRLKRRLLKPRRLLPERCVSSLCFFLMFLLTIMLGTTKSPTTESRSESQVVCTGSSQRSSFFPSLNTHELKTYVRPKIVARVFC